MSAIAVLPLFEVVLDGTALPEGSVAILEQVRVQQKLSQPSLCELTFFSTENPPAELENITPGSRLRLTLTGSHRQLFDGDVTAVEYSYEAHKQTIRVRCYDLLHRLRKRRPVRVHVQVTPADLAGELVADLQLSVEARERGPLLERFIQHEQSDLDLLVEVCRRYGLYLTLRGSGLHLIPLEGTGGPAVPLRLGQELMEVQVAVNGDPACRSVIARGWDVSRVESHQGRAVEARLGRRIDAAVPPDRLGASGEHILADEALEDDRQAEALAQAELDVQLSREVILTATADGNADLMPGARVNVSGIASRLAGEYVLCAVTHTINRRTGFVSEISTAPPLIERRSRAARAAWGRVTRVDDPEKLGRVRVALPAVGDVETDWLEVLAAGAGRGKGFVVVPDVSDQVLVLRLDENAAHGVVLGGLYGVHGPEDYGVEGTSVRRYFVSTPGGQRIRLDDTSDLIRVENKDGSFLELSPKKARLHANADLEIEAPGRAVVIAASRIDFKKA